MKNTKITRATFKSFIKKNRNNLWVKKKRYFNGMIDCVDNIKDPMFQPSKNDNDSLNEHTLGIEGVWLVRGSRDYFSPYEDKFYKGISVVNCCGSFIVVTSK